VLHVLFPSQRYWLCNNAIIFADWNGRPTVDATSVKFVFGNVMALAVRHPICPGSIRHRDRLYLLEFVVIFPFLKVNVDTVRQKELIT
jgi:hypothetical protein